MITRGRRRKHAALGNVIEQVANVCKTTILRDAWDRGQDVTVHGWIYGMSDGIVMDLKTSASSLEESRSCYRRAIDSIAR